MPVTKAPSPCRARRARLAALDEGDRAPGRAWPAAPADRPAPACRPRWRSGRRRRPGPAGCGTAPGRRRSARCRRCVSASLSAMSSLMLAHSLRARMAARRRCGNSGHAVRAHAGRVMDGAEDRRRGRHQAGLADALGAGGAERLAILDQDALDLRHVADGRDQIVVQVLGAAGQIFLHQRQAQALGDAALDLAFDQGRIDGPADIVGGDDAQHLHRAELDIDLDLGDLRGEGVGRVGHALAVGIERRGRRIEGALADQRSPTLARDRVARTSPPSRTVSAGAVERQRGVRPGIGQAQDLLAQVAAGAFGRLARDEGLARGRGLAGVGGEVGVAGDQRELRRPAGRAHRRRSGS